MRSFGTEYFDVHGPGMVGPKYQRVKQYLSQQLTCGRLVPGESLPSESQMASSYGVARNTVRQALAELENDGLIRRVPGKGTFVNENVNGRRQQSLNAFALIVPETRGGYYPSLLHTFEGACKELEKQAIVCNTGDDVKTQGNEILRLLDEHIAGVALVPTSATPTPAFHVRQLQNAGIPVVLCHRTVEGAEAPAITIPFDKIGFQTAQTLIENGHQRVAYYTSHAKKMGKVRLDMFRKTIIEAGGQLPDEFVFAGDSIDPREKEISNWVSQICNGPNPPTAICATFDSFAEAIHMALMKMGLRVPEDVSLLSFGGTWREGPTRKQLTAITVDESELGRHAVKLLNEMRDGTRRITDTEQIVMPLGMSQGTTLGTVGDCPDFRKTKMGLPPSTP